MRAAKPDEMKTHAYPVLAAAISEAELSKWFPVPFQHITDPQEAAEPSKAALMARPAKAWPSIATAMCTPPKDPFRDHSPAAG